MKRVPALFVIIGMLAGGTVAAAAIWYGGVRDQYLPKEFGVVVPGRLYRSGQISQRLIRKTLREHHISLIIDLSTGERNPASLEELKASQELSINRLNLFLVGNGTGDPQVYAKALAAIVAANAEGKAVLVHCQSGTQRTGGVIAAYRILVQGMTPAQAFTEAERYGHNPRHNPRLVPYVEEHLPAWKEQIEAQRAMATQPGSSLHPVN